MAGQFTLGQWMKSKDRHPTSEGISQFWNQKHVRRPGEHEPAWPAITVHGHFEGHEQAGGTLHFIQDGLLRKFSHEPDGVIGCRPEEGRVIERDVLVAVRRPYGLSQSGFPALPGPMHQDNGGILQSLHQAGSRKSGVKVRGTHVGRL